MYREVSGFFFYGSANGQTELSAAGEANVKNMEAFLHLQNRLPDLLDHRNTKLAIFFDGAQHSLTGPADFAIRSGRGAGLDVRKDGVDDGVVFLDGAKFSGVEEIWESVLKM